MRDGLRSGEQIELRLGHQRMTDLGHGRIVSDVREVYRFKHTGNFVYARDRRLELTVRDREIARYDMRIVG